mgnify:CR=1 FL=1
MEILNLFEKGFLEDKQTIEWLNSQSMAPSSGYLAPFVTTQVAGVNLNLAVDAQDAPVSLETANEQGRAKSRFLKETKKQTESTRAVPTANIEHFQKTIAPVLARKCVACHGDKGAGGSASGLIPKGPITSINGGEKTIGNFWPYASTLFDYIRRAMPWQQPKSLTNDEVYALTAYLLALNKIIDEGAGLDAGTLAKIKMPNRDGFIIRFPERI